MKNTSNAERNLKKFCRHCEVRTGCFPTLLCYNMWNAASSSSWPAYTLHSTSHKNKKKDNFKKKVEHNKNTLQEWFGNSLIQVICKQFSVSQNFSVESMTEKFFPSDNHCKTICQPIRSRCSSCKLKKNA